MTPRQRIVVRREMRNAEAAGNTALLAELRKDYEYDGIDTCAVDGMCQVACPVDINTGDLVRRLRQENSKSLEGAMWKTASEHWGAVTRAGSAALTVARAAPTPLVMGATRLARSVLDKDTVPLYRAELPGVGARRRPLRAENPVAVYFPVCIGTMFGPASGGGGVSAAFLTLCERVGLQVTIPEGISAFCCGTPWKSKGFASGYEHMRDTVLPALWTASRDGELAIVCDAASCTEGLQMMQKLAADHSDRFGRLRFIDAIDFVHDEILPHLPVTSPIDSVSLHPTCSSTQLGTNVKLTAIAEKISSDVRVPVNWACCGFAGDRGLLHPELTASATVAEAAEINAREYAAYASTNRTCELGMTRATGHEYQHLIELLEQATRES